MGPQYVLGSGSTLPGLAFIFAISLEVIALICFFDDTGTDDRHALRVD